MRRLFVALILGCVVGFASLAGTAEAKTIIGYASYYKHGKRTANGEPFNPNGLTAAHRTLPFGTKVRVTNLRNQRSVVLRVNDRGPYHAKRIGDVSEAAAKELGMWRRGTATATLEIVE